MITKEQADAELDRMERESATRLPSSMDLYRGARPKFPRSEPPIRWTPKAPSLSQLDRERQT